MFIRIYGLDPNEMIFSRYLELVDRIADVRELERDGPTDHRAKIERMERRRRR